MLITTTFSYSKMLIINVCLMILAEKYKVYFGDCWMLGECQRCPGVQPSVFPRAIVEKDSEYIELSDEVKVCYDN